MVKIKKKFLQLGGKTKNVLTSKVVKKVGKNILKSALVITLASVPVVYSSNAADMQAVPVSNSTIEGGKEALNAALKTARQKPALAVAAAISCLACAPAAGLAASPSICVACGILLAKVLG
jgi:hypothetical protein